MNGEEGATPQTTEGEVEEDADDCPRCLPEWRKYQKTGIGAFHGVINEGVKHRWWICPNCGKRHYVWE